ncbi:MAG: TRAP transporter large permease subunit [Deferrisomatales bacterium]|nr:TRAP transporter large permease subunit [Deferrisomatales bacterium]
MDWLLPLTGILGGVLFLFLIGVPVAFSFLAVNIIGVYIFWGGLSGLDQLILSIYRSVANFSLIPIPLFILMGEIMFLSGVAPRMMETLDRWLGRVPGRLGLLAVGGGAVFATLSGSAMSGCAMLGSTLVPEMERRGYKKPMSLGPILGAGGLAVMIPPSALGVLLASLGRFSVGGLLIAIIVPGLIMALCYGLYIVGRCWLQPQLAPVYSAPPIPLWEKLTLTVRYVLPLGLIIFLVIGLMIIGFATPTESAALGVMGCFLLAFVYKRKVDLTLTKKSTANALKITVMMFMILTGSTAFSQVLAFTGATRGLIELALGLDLPALMVIVLMMGILLVMGAFMEPLTIMMITLPIFMPVVQSLGFDPIWFGVLMLLNMEMATTTPPFGLVLFVMKGVAPPDTRMSDIYRAAIPFLLCDTVVLGLLLIFPQLSLWLPQLVRG